MTILGLDPGTTRAGYGIISQTKSGPKLIKAGILNVTEKKDKSIILQDINSGITKLCLEHKPVVVAIEKLYFSKNRKTALAVAEARGVMLLAVKERGLPIREYSPSEIKSNITGYGGADKKAVLKMVRLILKTPDLKVIDDASDALAVAIVAAQELRSRISQEGP